MSNTYLEPQTDCTLLTGAQGVPGRTRAVVFEAEARDSE